MKVGDKVRYEPFEGCVWFGVVEEVESYDVLIRWDDDGKCSHAPRLKVEVVDASE